MNAVFGHFESSNRRSGQMENDNTRINKIIINLIYYNLSIMIVDMQNNNNIYFVK